MGFELNKLNPPGAEAREFELPRHLIRPSPKTTTTAAVRRWRQRRGRHQRHRSTIGETYHRRRRPRNELIVRGVVDNKICKHLNLNACTFQEIHQVNYGGNLKNNGYDLFIVNRSMAKVFPLVLRIHK